MTPTESRWIGTFVTVPAETHNADRRNGERAEVVAIRADLLTLRYADGSHRAIMAGAVLMSPDQTTPVWVAGT